MPKRINYSLIAAVRRTQINLEEEGKQADRSAYRKFYGEC